MVLSVIGSIDKIPDDATLHIKGIFSTGNYIYEYGTLTYSNGDTDGILKVKGTSDEPILKYVTFDDGGYERFEFVALTDNLDILIVCEEYEFLGDLSLPVFRQTVIMRLSCDGSLIDKIYLKTNFVEYHNHNFHLVLIDAIGDITYIGEEMIIKDSIHLQTEYSDNYYAQYVGEAYVNGVYVENLEIDYPGYYEIEIVDGEYHFLYEIYIKPTITIQGNKFEDSYIGEISIVSKGLIFINGEYYESGTPINICGNYNIKIYGENFYSLQEDITVLPTITYLIDGDYQEFRENMEVSQPIFIYSDAISMLMDSNNYASGILTSTGSHELTIYGAGNYILVLNFSVIPYMEGIENGKVYETVSLEIFGTGILNGQLVSGNIVIEEPGEYTLELLYGEDTYETYTFTISDNELINSDRFEILNYLNYILLAVIGIGAYFIFRKK